MFRKWRVAWSIRAEPLLHLLLLLLLLLLLSWWSLLQLRLLVGRRSGRVTVERKLRQRLRLQRMVAVLLLLLLLVLLLLHIQVRLLQSLSVLELVGLQNGPHRQVIELEEHSVGWSCSLPQSVTERLALHRGRASCSRRRPSMHFILFYV